jgi:Rrf2 family protein
MKLSRTVAYAIQATLQLAQSNTNGPVPCSKLAAEGDMPERFLLQILRNLVTHGILQSTRGVEGGYSLLKPPEEISVLEIIEAIEGPLASRFPAAGGLDGSSHARMQSALDEVAAAARRQLQSIKLSQIVRPETVDRA